MSKRSRARASPHTRGWTQAESTYQGRDIGFPAHAGMDPDRAGVLHSIVGFPAHAGMDPPRTPARLESCGLPRTRGDGPPRSHQADSVAQASPHTRGWTPGQLCRRRTVRGFPAHAGMDPPETRVSAGLPGLPRTRGDGPAPFAVTFCRVSASPHTRGWTHTGGGERPLAGDPRTDRGNRAGRAPRDRRRGTVNRSSPDPTPGRMFATTGCNTVTMRPRTSSGSRHPCEASITSYPPTIRSIAPQTP